MEWISVEDRLPKRKPNCWSKAVIALADNGEVFRLSYYGGWQRTKSFIESGAKEITHWMPLPEVPK